MTDYARAIREPPDDPNPIQNKRLTPSEISLLRNIRSENRQSATTVQSQLSKAKDMYEEIQARYDSLSLDDEGVKSELNGLYPYIRMLQKKATLHQEEEERLAKLLHPIHRCPEDVLRLIFEQAIRIKEDDWFAVATTVSHVCRSWRISALQMSFLWSRIIISPEKCPGGINALISFLERSQSRVQLFPVVMTIRDIGSPVPGTRTPSASVWKSMSGRASKRRHEPMFYDTIQLIRFSHILRLNLHLTDSKDIRCLENPAFKYDLGPLECLTIGSKSWTRNAPSWDCTYIFRQFPTAKRVIFNSLGPLYMEGDDTFPSIYRLTLEKTDIQNLISHIRRFICVEMLFIEESKFIMNPVVPMMDEIVSDTLQSLYVSNVQNFPWSRLRAPRLISVRFDDKVVDVIDCVRRHPSICDFHCGRPIMANELQILASELIHLHTLGIIGSFQELYHYQDSGFVSIPFPKLSYLRVKLGYGFTLSLQEFESLVQTRCLLELVQGQNGVENLKFLKFTGRVEDFEPWRNSSLLDHFDQIWSVEASDPSRYSFVLNLKYEL